MGVMPPISKPTPSVRPPARTQSGTHPAVVDYRQKLKSLDEGSTSMAITDLDTKLSQYLDQVRTPPPPAMVPASEADTMPPPPEVLTMPPPIGPPLGRPIPGGTRYAIHVEIDVDMADDPEVTKDFDPESRR